LTNRDALPIFALVTGAKQKRRRQKVDNQIENWLPVPGYEGQYEISDRYRVRRLARDADHGIGSDFTRSLKARFLSLSRNNGYLVAYLCKPGERNKSKKLYVEATAENLFPYIKPVIEDISEPGEEWRSIAGYEGLYEISNIGRIKSVGWYVNGGAKRRYARPTIRVNGADSNGYPKVELAKKGEIRTISIHRLVAQAFVPNPFELPLVHHKDEVKTNCRADNLEWISRAANVQDWFDRRRLTINTDTIGLIEAALAEGRNHAEILALLPQRKKKRR